MLRTKWEMRQNLKLLIRWSILASKMFLLLRLEVYGTYILYRVITTLSIISLSRLQRRILLLRPYKSL